MPIWYLRVIAVLNLVSAVSLTARQEVHTHNSGQLFTPFMLFAGYGSAAAALFMAMVLARHKRMAWLVFTALCGGYAALSVWGLAYPELRQHPFNWVSTALTLAVLACTVLGRREFHGKGDRTNPQLALAVLGVGALLSVLVGTTLVAAVGPDGASVGDRVWYVAVRLATLSRGRRHRPQPAREPAGRARASTSPGSVCCWPCSSRCSAPRAAASSRAARTRTRLRGLLDRHGARDSLGYFALRRDKSVICLRQRQGGRRLPGGRRGRAGLRRPDRRPRGVAGRDRRRGWLRPASTPGSRR